MYFVVPKDRSVIRSVGKHEALYDAVKLAENLRRETGEHYDIILLKRVMSTYTEADSFEQDLAEEAAQ